ncbi:hypothetical protein KEM52_005350, partial [Ascosphaera acerosa]
MGPDTHDTPADGSGNVGNQAPSAVDSTTSRGNGPGEATSDVSQTPEVSLRAAATLPEWYRENSPYIEQGFRPVSNSVWDSLRSWTYLHNESVNIFTHLIPALVYLMALITAGTGLVPQQADGGMSIQQMMPMFLPALLVIAPIIVVVVPIIIILLMPVVFVLLVVVPLLLLLAPLLPLMMLFPGLGLLGLIPWLRHMPSMGRHWHTIRRRMRGMRRRWRGMRRRWQSGHDRWETFRRYFGFVTAILERIPPWLLPVLVVIAFALFLLWPIVLLRISIGLAFVFFLLVFGAPLLLFLGLLFPFGFLFFLIFILWPLCLVPVAILLLFLCPFLLILVWLPILTAFFALALGPLFFPVFLTLLLVFGLPLLFLICIGHALFCFALLLPLILLCFLFWPLLILLWPLLFFWPLLLFLIPFLLFICIFGRIILLGPFLWLYFVILVIIIILWLRFAWLPWWLPLLWLALPIFAILVILGLLLLLAIPLVFFTPLALILVPVLLLAVPIAIIVGIIVFIILLIIFLLVVLPIVLIYHSYKGTIAFLSLFAFILSWLLFPLSLTWFLPNIPAFVWGIMLLPLAILAAASLLLPRALLPFFLPWLLLALVLPVLGPIVRMSLPLIIFLIYTSTNPLRVFFALVLLDRLLKLIPGLRLRLFPHPHLDFGLGLLRYPGPHGWWLLFLIALPTLLLLLFITGILKVDVPLPSGSIPDNLISLAQEVSRGRSARTVLALVAALSSMIWLVVPSLANHALSPLAHILPMPRLHCVSEWDIIPRTISGARKASFTIFVTAAFVCMTFSAVYHTLLNHSRRVARISAQLDFIGIIVLIAGTVISGVVLEFFQYPRLRKSYVILVSSKPLMIRTRQAHLCQS